LLTLNQYQLVASVADNIGQETDMLIVTRGNTWK
jgi:hypothetical protein